MSEAQTGTESPQFGALLKFDPETSRLLDVARSEFVSHGIRRASISEIARRAGVSRPTLFRRCGDKDDIVTAVAARDLVEFFARAQVALKALESLEDKVVEAFVLGVREAREHPMIQALKEFDDRMLLQKLLDTNSPSARMMLHAIAQLVQDEGVTPSTAIENALEISLRITATLLASPSTALPTDSDESARAFARQYLTAIVHAALQT